MHNWHCDILCLSEASRVLRLLADGEADFALGEDLLASDRIGGESSRREEGLGGEGGADTFISSVRLRGAGEDRGWGM